MASPDVLRSTGAPARGRAVTELRRPDPLTSEEWSARAGDFLALEAYLLDSRRFEEWIELFEPEGIYWIPLDPAAFDPGDTLNIAFEGPTRLRQRVARLHSGIAHAQEPPSSTVRVYGGVFVAEVFDDGCRALVRSALMVHESRLGHRNLVAARCEHRLVVDEGGKVRIEQKRVLLADSDQAQYDLSFIL